VTVTVVLFVSFVLTRFVGLASTSTSFIGEDERGSLTAFVVTAAAVAIFFRVAADIVEESKEVPMFVPCYVSALELPRPAASTTNIVTVKQIALQNQNKSCES
jgi:hypothetical protein